MTPDDERLEGRLRDAFQAGDPGPPPRTLLDRVAAVPTTKRRSMGDRWSVLRLARPAVALTATGVAVVVGVLLTASLRSTGLTTPANPSPGVGAPAPTVDLRTVGFVPAIPIWFLVGGIVVSLIVAAFALESVPGIPPFGIVQRPPRGMGWIVRPSARRLAFALLVGGAIAGGAALSGIGALARGGTWSPSLEHYMGDTPGIAGNRDLAFFRNVPGATISFSQDIVNETSVPVTILGGDPSMPWLELRIFDPASEGTVQPDVENSYPFAPFELQPHAARLVMFAIHIASDCGLTPPAPSPEPTPDLSASYTPPDSGGEASLDSVALRYSVLGLERTDEFFFDPVPVLWSPSTGSCGFDADWASPSPSAR